MLYEQPHIKLTPRLQSVLLLVNVLGFKGLLIENFSFTSSSLAWFKSRSMDAQTVHLDISCGQVLASVHQKGLREVPWKSAAGWQDLSSPELAGGRLDTKDSSRKQ